MRCARLLMRCSASRDASTTRRARADDVRCAPTRRVQDVADVFAVCDQTEQALCLTTQTRAFALRQTAPDAVAFAVRERVFEAIETHVAVDAHTLRGITRTAALREEQIGIFPATQRAFLPVVTDPPHARPPVRKDSQDCNYVRVIVVTRSLLSRGGFIARERDTVERCCRAAIARRANSGTGARSTRTRRSSPPNRTIRASRARGSVMRAPASASVSASAAASVTATACALRTSRSATARRASRRRARRRWPSASASSSASASVCRPDT